jgi:DNA-binding transcriptional LysR family regulator
MMSAKCRFCCRSQLRAFLVGDSVAVMRAVSHGIKSLEEWLNVALFDRRKPELVLTPAGHDYLPYINDALSKIAQGTDEILPNNRNSHDTPAIEGGDAAGAATATRFQPVVLGFPGT